LDTAIDTWIREAEEQWLYLFQQHASALFSRTFLPSHDHSHHQRVWNNSKQLLRELARIKSPVDRTVVEGVLVAAWFHDLGMVHHRNKEHGPAGRVMCEEFFRERGLTAPSRFGEILEAIEKHDSKEDAVYDTFLPGQPPGILHILSICDDLDAMGNIGVYRYTEIYLHRGIPLHHLGIRILENGRTRYRNMLKSCTHCSPMIRSVSRQYATLEEFFNLYNQQLLVEKSAKQVPRGQLGIVNTIRRLSLAGKIRPERFLDQLELLEPPVKDNTVMAYFKSLTDELENGGTT